MHPETTRGRVVALTIAVALALALAATAAPAMADIRDEWLARAHDVAMWRFPFVCQPITYDDVHKPVPGDWLGLARRGGNPCTVYIRSDWRTWSYQRLCQVVVHEVGHLSGRGHVRNLESIMYEYAPVTLDWRPCRPGWHW